MGERPLTRVRDGCDLCWPAERAEGRSWCVRCRPEEFAAEVERLRAVFCSGGQEPHYDELNQRMITVRVISPPRPHQVGMA